MPVGQTNYPVPAGALFVSASGGNDSAAGTPSSPLRTAQAAVDRASNGQTIVLRGGTYHEQVVIGAKVLTIQAYPGEAVWFDGSSAATSWTKSGSSWVSSGWSAKFDSSASFSKGSNAGGFVGAANPMASHPDQVFVDGKQLEQIGDGQTPKAGQFSVNYGKQTVTIGTDPNGKNVRVSDLGQAILSSGKVTLRGFGVRAYATSLPSMGTVYLGGKLGGSVVENVVIDNNATQGLSITSQNVTVTQVSATNNGMVGIHGNQSDRVVVRNSLVEGNNSQRFNAAPSAGGIKITRTRGVTIQSNVVRNNISVIAIWLDESVVGFTIVGNVVSGGSAPYGILTELSDTGIVASNYVSGAKYGYSAFNTGNVKVFNNYFTGNSVWDLGLTQDERRQGSPGAVGRDPRAPVPDPSCTWTVRNIVAANNVFANDANDANPGFQFYGLDKRTGVSLDKMNVVIDGNVFSAPQADHAPRMVAWGGSNNVALTIFHNPQQLATAKNKSWTNLLTTQAKPTPNDLQGKAPSIGVPLPADVAAALGVPAGTVHVGRF